MASVRKVKSRLQGQRRQARKGQAEPTGQFLPIGQNLTLTGRSFIDLHKDFVQLTVRLLSFFARTCESLIAEAWHIPCSTTVFVYLILQVLFQLSP
jgi:hypothetical protein